MFPKTSMTYYSHGGIFPAEVVCEKMFSISGKQTEDKRANLDDERVECEIMMNLWDKDLELAEGIYDPVNYLDVDQLEEKMFDD